MCNSIIFNVL